MTESGTSRSRNDSEDHAIIEEDQSMYLRRLKGTRVHIADVAGRRLIPMIAY